MSFRLPVGRATAMTRGPPSPWRTHTACRDGAPASRCAYPVRWRTRKPLARCRISGAVLRSASCRRPATRRPFPRLTTRVLRDGPAGQSMGDDQWAITMQARRSSDRPDAPSGSPGARAGQRRIRLSVHISRLRSRVSCHRPSATQTLLRQSSRCCSAVFPLGLPQQAFDVLGNDVDLEVHRRSDRAPDPAWSVRGWSGSARPRTSLRFGAQRRHRQRNPVDGDRALLDDVAGHCRRAARSAPLPSAPTGVRDSTCPVPSTWPCTMCPPSRLLTAAARSRFTRAADVAVAPRLDRFSVSAITSAVNCAVGQHARHRQAHAVDGDRIAVPGVRGDDGPRMMSRAASGRSSRPVTSPEFLDNSGEHCHQANWPCRAVGQAP